MTLGSFRTGCTESGERNLNPIRSKPALAREPSRESARNWNIDIENSTTPFAVEMMMRLDVSVITLGTHRARHLLDITVGDEHLEVSIDGPERERR
jgi:hypothetical protein